MKLPRKIRFNLWIAMILLIGLAGCGGGPRTETSAVEPPAKFPAPSIQVVHKQLPFKLLQQIAREESENTENECFTIQKTIGSGGRMLTCPDAVNDPPLKNKPAFVIAKLTLRKSAGFAAFTMYESRSHRTCFDVQLLNAEGYGWVPLECVADNTCPQVCLQTYSDGAGAGGVNVVAGLVDAGASAIAVPLQDGRVQRFSLAGPLAPATDRRIFMAQLPSDKVLYREIALSYATHKQG